jgi:uncharacterized membrane protein
MFVGLYSKIKRVLWRDGLYAYHMPVKKNIIVPAVIIIAVSFLFFFYFQQQTEQSIRDTMLEQQKQIQKDTTKSLAQYIRSDMDSIMGRLQGLSLSQ